MATIETTTAQNADGLDDFRHTYSDFYKEAYGFRPRRDTSKWTAERWEQEFTHLSEVCSQNAAVERQAEERAAVAFEGQVAKLITLGAKDRAATIRWLADAEGADSNGYLEYCLGLRYGYLTQT